MSISDLEERWKQEAIDAGVFILQENVTDCLALESTFSRAKIFIGADGSKSLVRNQIFGELKSIDYNFQYMIEVKFSTKDKSAKCLEERDMFKVQKILNHYASEFVKSQQTVIVRFLVSREVYEKVPDCPFKQPLRLHEQWDQLCECPSLQHDVNVFLNARKLTFPNEQYEMGSGLLTKTALGIYKSASVAVGPEKANDQDIDFWDVVSESTFGNSFPREKNISSCGKRRQGYWFLIGDAAMGVPFYRSLNAGLEASSKLISTITDPITWAADAINEDYGLSLAVHRHEVFYGVISVREGTEAAVKSTGIDTITTGYHLLNFTDNVGVGLTESYSDEIVAQLESFRNELTYSCSHVRAQPI